MTKSLLSELFAHNTWANLEIIDVCSKLTEDQLNATSPGTYGSIRDTLIHVASAQERYVRRLTGQELSPDAIEEGTFVGFEKLRERVSITGERLLALSSDVSWDRELALEWGGTDYTVMAGVILLQVINHSTEHRGQIATILGSLGTEPPGIDGWGYGMANGGIFKRA